MKSLEDKAREYAFEVGTLPINAANRLVGYKSGYKQAIEDLLERAKEKSFSLYPDEGFLPLGLRIETLEQITEDLKA